MKCPVCKQLLLTCEIADLELDYCARDHGYWVDKGELEALLHSPVPVLRGHTPGTTGARRCPRCGKPMTLHRSDDGLELDLCPYGDGIWFDEAELAVLLAKLSDRTSSELTHLTHVFNALATKLGGAPL